MKTIRRNTEKKRSFILSNQIVSIIVFTSLLFFNSFSSQAQWISNGSNITTTNNIGINVTSPIEKLELNGNAKINGSILLGGNSGSIYYGVYALRFQRKSGFRANFAWENQNKELMTLNASNGLLSVFNSISTPILDVNKAIADTLNTKKIFINGVERPLDFIERLSSRSFKLNLDQSVASVYYGSYALRSRRNSGWRAHFAWENQNEDLMTLNASNGQLNVLNDIVTPKIDVENVLADTINVKRFFVNGIERPLDFIEPLGNNNFKLKVGGFAGSIYYDNYALRFKRNSGFRAQFAWENDQRELMTLDAQNGNLALEESLSVGGTINAAGLIVNGKSFQEVETRTAGLEIGTAFSSRVVTQHDDQAAAIFQNINIPEGGNANYALLNGRRGRTQLNASAGKTIAFAIDGDVKMRLETDGDFTVGRSDQKQQMTVYGDVVANRMAVAANPDSFTAWPDYVFNKDYNLMPIEKLDDFIKNEKHLPEVPSASQIATEGFDLEKMDATLLKKVEELTLYIIEQNKQLSKQNERIEQLESKMATQK